MTFLIVILVAIAFYDLHLIKQRLDKMLALMQDQQNEENSGEESPNEDR